MSSTSIRLSHGFRTFEDYLIDEGFFDSLSQGFKQNYAQAKTATSGGEEAQYAKYAKKAMEAIDKSRQTANQFAQKLGIDLTLATALVASGVVGGPAVVPMTALLYFVRKPINKAASAGFDKAADKMGWSGNANQAQAQQPQAQAQQPQAQAQQPQAQAQQPQAQAQSNLWLPGQQQRPNPNAKIWTPSSMQNSWNLSFSGYADARDMNEGWFGDKVSQAGNWLGKKIGGAEDYAGKKVSQGKQWWDDGGADKVGGAIGGVAGKVAGKTAKGANMIKSSMSSIAKFASENKLALGKAAFMVAIGAAIGAGVGAGFNMLSDALGSVASAGVPETEVMQLHKELGVEPQSKVTQSADPVIPGHHYDRYIPSSSVPSPSSDSGFLSHGGGRYSNPDGTTGWVDPNPGGPGTTKLGQSIVNTPAGEYVPNTSDRFWGGHIGEPGAHTKYLQEPGVDTTGTLPKGRLYGGEVGTEAPHWSKMSDSEFSQMDQARRQTAIDMGNSDPGSWSREDYQKQDDLEQTRSKSRDRMQAIRDRIKR